MPLTNAEKQKRTRQRKAERMTRSETALSMIVRGKFDGLEVAHYSAKECRDIAYRGLHGDLRSQLTTSLSKEHRKASK